ncbi:nucleotide exchange factor GrpE [Mucilaginibacter lacusdianchii]|uniref:nucleotide exchange factor GrpE n=1 Tax=Mucilaginibacter lacusdianchii TaxID=2684211 RepID=UPI001E606FA1|nr:nucleotide exchange factor GrpE [Mucilaginibacter sp. JXJ CY 39]
MARNLICTIIMNFKDMFNNKKKQETSSPEDLNDVNTENTNTTPEQEENPLADELNANEPVEATEVSAESKLKEELAQANDKYLRLYAEFDNFKRRTTKERVELLQTAGKEVIVSLLPVLDDFERAVKAMENASDVSAVKEGVLLVQNKLNGILKQKGLKEMEAKGTAFDADIHEAITNIPAPTDDLKGKVVDELEKGYYLNDKVVRFAKVVVGA